MAPRIRYGLRQSADNTFIHGRHGTVGLYLGAHRKCADPGCTAGPAMVVVEHHPAVIFRAILAKRRTNTGYASLANKADLGAWGSTYLATSGAANSRGVSLSARLGWRISLEVRTARVSILA